MVKKSREKGVATAPCPNCGQDLPLAEQPDGGLAAEACPKCYPSKVREEASASGSKRETGTNVKKED